MGIYREIDILILIYRERYVVHKPACAWRIRACVHPCVRASMHVSVRVCVRACVLHVCYHGSSL